MVEWFFFLIVIVCPDLNVDCSRFRLGAIDHGLFSFIDTHHNDWPIVLVTNPKNYLFNIPHREHPNLQKGNSTFCC